MGVLLPHVILLGIEMPLLALTGLAMSDNVEPLTA
jgi:hypothetical protein